MLDVGFSELLLILAAAAVLIGPKDMPVVIRSVARFFRQLNDLTGSVKRQMREVVAEVESTTTIIDLEGRPQKAYDVAELKSLASPKDTP